MTKSKATLYAAAVTCLGFLCLAIASVAIAIPYWGYYDTPHGGYDYDHGYFGPFHVCKQLAYNRKKCGSDVSKFKLSPAIFISGLFAVVCCAILGIFSILSILQIAMISSREKVVMSYEYLVMTKMIIALVSCMLALVATIIFAVQIDETEKYGFHISRGISFYLQIVVVLLTVGLFVLALYDVLYTKRPGGDPTMMVDVMSPTSATTINNPGFKELRTRNGVSVTDASGKPYANIRNGSGSVASMSTMVTSVSNGSSTVESITRSPLRSSLKKPRPPRNDENVLGIQNPGYSGSASSPTAMRRNNSVKKVRIQTHSTEV